MCVGGGFLQSQSHITFEIFLLDDNYVPLLDDNYIPGSNGSYSIDTYHQYFPLVYGFFRIEFQL